MKKWIFIVAACATVSHAAVERQNSATEGLVELYPEENFGGTPVVLSAEGTYDQDYDNATAMSIKVKKGYVAVIYPRIDEGYYFVKPEDDATFTDDSPIILVNTIKKIEVVKRDAIAPFRPRIFMTMHGNNELTLSEHQDKWTYVREHADGIWWNAASTTWEQRKNFVDKFKNKHLVEEMDRQGLSGFQGPSIDDTGLNQLLDRYPELESQVTFEAIGIYKGVDLQNWGADEMADMNEAWMDTVPAAGHKRFNGAMAVWHIGSFGTDTGYPYIGDYPNALAIFDTGAGNCVELAPGHFLNSTVYRKALIEAMTRSHQVGTPFYWFMTRHSPITGGEYVTSDPRVLQDFKNAYYLMEYLNMIRADDVYFLIAYRNTLRNYPEADENGNEMATTSGITYWMLHQGHQSERMFAAVPYDEESDPGDDSRIRDQGTHIGYIKDGTWVRYNDIDFGSDGIVRSMEVSAATPGVGGEIELRLGSVSGTLLGTIEVSNTDGWQTHRTFGAPILSTSGMRDLVFVFRGEGTNELFNIESFTLITPPEDDLDRLASAASFDVESDPGNDSIINDAGTYIGFIKDGSWVRYNGFYFGSDGAERIDISAATPGAGGSIEIRLGSDTGTLVGTVEITSTGGWQSYQTFSAPLLQTTGVQDLVFVFNGAGAGELMNVESFIIHDPLPPYDVAMDPANGSMTFSWSRSGQKIQARTNLVSGTWHDFEEGLNTPATVVPTNPASFFRVIAQ